MTFRFSKKEAIVLVLSVLLTAAAVFGGYYLYLEPKYKDIDSAKATLKTNQELLATLQQQQKKTSDITAESVAVLQRKVPVKPQLEQLILDLEKAEVVSGSSIKNMSFSEGDIVPPPAPAPTEEGAQATDENKEGEAAQSADKEKTDETEKTDESKATNETTNEGNKTAENGAENTYQPTPLPGGIKRLMVTLQIESANYEEAKKFIEALEGLPRTVVVETVGFTSKAEVTNLDEEPDVLSYTLTLSAFFMPTLTDLQDKLPELVAPPPANKTNPFNRFPDLNR
jgi:type IV pilus assembly protein PilO